MLKKIPRNHFKHSTTKRILIQVADEGIGIKNEFKELIFERFFELETKKQEILKELVWGCF